MTIYVDESLDYATAGIKPPARRHGRTWCHLMHSGDVAELHRFAARLGLAPSAFQPARRWQFEHYDLTPAKRALAVRLGAVELSRRERGRQTAAQIAAEEREILGPAPGDEEG